MRIEKQRNKGMKRLLILYVLLGTAVLFPVVSSYVMSGEGMPEWTARVEELAAGFQSGRLYLFPSAQTLAAGNGVKGMDSNMWLFFPGAVYWISGNPALTYRIYMLLVQIGTLGAAVLMFHRVFGRKDAEMPRFCGVLLYMTCPCRIFLSYDLADFSQIAAWMLLPLYLWAVIGIAKEEGKRSVNILTAAVALAGTGYADVVYFLTAAGVSVLVGLFGRKLWVLVSAAAGGVIFLPGVWRLVSYVFLDGFGELGIPLKSIMPEGYRFGEFFNFYVFRDSHPGMGLGMLICVLSGIWLGFVERKRAKGVNRVFTFWAVLFALLSLSRFPWDMVQRLGSWALRLVSLLDTPAVFWGMACVCLSVSAAGAVDEIGRHENRRMAAAVPVMVTIACLCVCVYQCGLLMNRNAMQG